MALTIAIDARELLGATTGVGRYLGELLVRWLARLDAAARRFVLYAPAPLPAAVTSGADVRILIGPGAVQLPEGTYQAWVRVTRPDERPVLPSGLAPII